MTDERTLDQRRDALLARLDELILAIDQGRDAARPVELDQSAVGRLSRMDAMQSQALSAEAQRRRELDASRVRSALARLEDGTYGDCLDCGEPIANKRLDHDPAATVCIACARAR